MGYLDTGWNLLKAGYKYTPNFLKASKGGALRNAEAAVAKGLGGGKNLRRVKMGGAGAVALGTMIGGNGPDADETTQRAMNQLRYGADMTNEQLAEAQAAGQTFKDTGIFGEGGLSEEQAMAYIQQNADQRGTGERIGGGVLNALSLIPGYGQAVGLIGGKEYDRRLRDARGLNLENIVGKLKADANEGKIRRNMEGTMGKFMTEGILDKDFGRGDVRPQGGIRPADDPEEAAALKEYEAIKARDGVHAAIAHPSALKAGRQVYLDVQEASGGDKNTAEALLSGAGGQGGVGLTDQPTMEKYYGDPEKNAAANAAREAAAKQSSDEAAAKKAAEEQAALGPTPKEVARSGEIDLKPATNPEEVRNAQATIATQKGYHGQSPISVEQTAYLNAHGMKSSRQLDESMNEDPWKALFARHQKQSWDNQQKARNYIAPEHRMGVDPNGDAWRAEQAAKLFNPASGPVGQDGKPLNPVAPAPAPATAPLPAQVNAAATAPGTTPEQKYGPQALEEAKKNGTLLSPNPNVMKPTPNGLGGPTPGFPQLPDIGAPVRNAVENALTQKSSAPGNVMRPTPYGLGTATPGMPQLPDIGAPVRNAVEGLLTQKSSAPGNIMKPSPYGLGTATPGVPSSIPQGIPDIGAPVRNAVQGALTQQSSPPGVAPKKPMDQAEIAKMLAEQKRKEIEARNRANPQSSPMSRPDPMRRFR